MFNHNLKAEADRRINVSKVNCDKEKTKDKTLKNCSEKDYLKAI